MAPRPTRTLVALMMLALSPVAAFAGGDGWSSNVAESLAKAKTENKHVIMDFTGSDWCSWCIKLNKEVFSQAAFKDNVPKSFVLIELDFPRDKSKITPEIATQNKEWSQKLGVRGYPSIYLCDAEGKPYAKTGYRRGGPESYVKHLDELKAMKTEADALQAKAGKAEGVEKAKILDKLLGFAAKGLIVSDADKVMGQIIEADAKDEAGLKSKYEEKLKKLEAKRKMDKVRTEIRQAMRKGPNATAEIVKIVDKAIADKIAQGDDAQQLLYTKTRVLMGSDKPAAKAALKQAIAASPNSRLSSRLKQTLSKHFADVADVEDVEDAPKPETAPEKPSDTTK